MGGLGGGGIGRGNGEELDETGRTEIDPLLSSEQDPEGSLGLGGAPALDEHLLHHVRGQIDDQLDNDRNNQSVSQHVPPRATV